MFLNFNFGPQRGWVHMVLVDSALRYRDFPRWPLGGPLGGLLPPKTPRLLGDSRPEDPMLGGCRPQDPSLYSGGLRFPDPREKCLVLLSVEEPFCMLVFGLDQELATKYNPKWCAGLIIGAYCTISRA